MIDVLEALAVTVGAVILLRRDRQHGHPRLDLAPLPEAFRIIPPHPYDWQQDEEREQGRTETKGTPPGRSSR